VGLLSRTRTLTFGLQVLNNHFTITSLQLQSFCYQWDFCPERVLLPLDYKF
jgi:hypothetical protein